MNYDELRRQKKLSQERFYKALFESRDDGSYRIDKRCLRSKLIKKENLPKLGHIKLPKFD